MPYRFELFVITIITLAFISCNHSVETNLIMGKEGKTQPTSNLLLPDSTTICHTSQIKGKQKVTFSLDLIARIVNNK